MRPNYTDGMLQAERLWKWITLHDYFAGNFMWTGIDYLGESTWPFKGFASGAMDITGHPKDSYYLYQSLWTDRPVLRLFPHWNWPGRRGQVIPVLAYTNCNIVELFLNGRSLGEKRLEFPAQGTAGGWNTYAQPVVRADHQRSAPELGRAVRAGGTAGGRQAAGWDGRLRSGGADRGSAGRHPPLRRPGHHHHAPGRRRA